jgi:hypothetical protein
MSLHIPVRRATAAQININTEVPIAGNRRTRFAALARKSCLPVCFKNTSDSDGSAASMLYINTALAPRNSSSIQTAESMAVEPKSRTEENHSLQLNAYNLAQLNGDAVKRCSSKASDAVTDITKCLFSWGIEDVPQPRLPDIKTSKPTLIKIIGNGRDGLIWSAKMKHGEGFIDVAVKKPIFHSKRRFAIDIKKQDFEKELHLAQSISHPHIVKTYGYCHSTEGMIMELAAGDVKTITINLYEVSDDDRIAIQRAIIKQMIDGLFYLFRKRILHNDTHLKNFFYKKGGIIVLGDFGQAVKVPKGYEKEAAMFKCITRLEANVSSIPDEDMALINEIKALPEKSLNKSEERKLRDTFIQLWVNSQKWDCLSDEELATKVEPLLEKTHG